MRARAAVRSHTEQNFMLYVMYLVVLFAGICVGAAIVNVVSDETCRQVVEPLKNGVGDGAAGQAAKVIYKTFVSSMKPVLFMWIAGFTGFSVYCIILSMAYKGGLLGFVIGVFVRIFGLSKGIMVSFASILPQNLIYIPILFLMAGFSYKYSLERKKRVGRNKIGYLFKLLLCAAGCALVALTDAYITAFFIKLSVNGG